MAGECLSPTAVESAVESGSCRVPTSGLSVFGRRGGGFRETYIFKSHHKLRNSSVKFKHTEGLHKKVEILSLAPLTK